MIDFATLQGLTIPEGVVTKIESGGVVLWELKTGGGPVILEVEKITSDTYAGETTYNSESFILLDIYPKTNGTVSITYGGLTKTITDTTGAEKPNAVQVFFGTFNGVSDEVETPASGTLTIEGSCRGVGTSAFTTSSKSYNKTQCACVTEITQMDIDIPASAFYNNTSLRRVCLQNGVKEIGYSAFNGCKSLEYVYIPKTVNDIYSVEAGSAHSFYNTAEIENPIVIDPGNAYYRIDGNCLIRSSDNVLLAGFINSVIPQGVTKLNAYAFYNSAGLESVTIPDSVTSISRYSFYGCNSLANVIFENPSGWYVTESLNGDITTGTAVDLSDPVKNAELLRNTYYTYYWYRS